ncbi:MULTISPECIES: hypothetical protein [unclassified Streptomyces]|uniref:hypothetical protein n=1 Tax=unclassified Streptomyces TaxID=2593676 RepID=UPI0033AFECB6
MSGVAGTLRGTVGESVRVRVPYGYEDGCRTGTGDGAGMTARGTIVRYGVIPLLLGTALAAWVGHAVRQRSLSRA